MKGEGVGTLGHFHDSLILGALGGVVLSQFCAEATSLDTYHGIDMRIEVLLPAEDFGGNLVLLRSRARVVHGLIGKIMQQLAKRLRPVEGMATEKLLNLRELLGPITHQITHRN